MPRNDEAYDLEMIKLRWDEFKYRHTHYWDLFFKFSFSILFLMSIPYVYPEKLTGYSAYVIFFPIAAILMCLIATWLLSAEYERLRSVGKKLNEITPPEYLPERFDAKLTGIGKVLSVNVGVFVNVVFLFGFMALAYAELIVILTR